MDASAQVTAPAVVSLLGRGWAFPIGLDGTGEIATVSDDEDVRQAILIILRTDKGERVMNPEFGAGLTALMFEPLSQTTLSLARHRVEQALVVWEPRIDHVQVTATADGALGRLDIEIRYRVRATNTFYNLVYPLYVQEGRS